MAIEFKKNQQLDVECVDVNGFGLGVCKANDFVLFVKDLLPGEKARIVVTKVTATFGYAHVLERYNNMSQRNVPVCSLFPQCGGCQIMHATYAYQLSLKENDVSRVLADFKEVILPIVGMENPLYYRNKVMIPLDDEKAGFYRLNSHNIVDMDWCYIQSKALNEVYHFIKQFLISKKIKEVFTIILREGSFSQEIMVALASEHPKIPFQNELVHDLVKAFPKIKSIMLNVHAKKSNTLLSKHNVVLFGANRISEKINGLTFYLSLNSFFQVNSYQTQRLYQIVGEFAALKKDEVVLDLYCGVGTIGLSLANRAKEVIGVDIVSSAIDNAKENAELNGIDNATFYCMDASEFVSSFNRQVDVVVVDPPRKGLTKAGISDILRLLSKRIVYVSCNIHTLVRDLNVFKSVYAIEKIQPVDMFPMSRHVETVALLSKLDVNQHIKVELEMDELDLTAAESKATYEAIRNHVLDRHGMKVSNLYISQIKRKCGLEVGKNYNVSKKEKQIIPKCPPEKEEAIREALIHFKMI